MLKRHMQTFSKSAHINDSFGVQILRSAVHPNRETLQPAHISVWWNYSMIAALLLSSSVTKALRDCVAFIGCIPPDDHIVGSIAALCCGYQLLFHMLWWNVTVCPGLWVHWWAHHSHRGDITPACDVDRGERLYWESAGQDAVLSCLCEEFHITARVKDQPV